PVRQDDPRLVGRVVIGRAPECFGLVRPAFFVGPGEMLVLGPPGYQPALRRLLVFDDICKASPVRGGTVLAGQGDLVPTAGRRLPVRGEGDDRAEIEPKIEPPGG